MNKPSISTNDIAPAKSAPGHGQQPPVPEPELLADADQIIRWAIREDMGPEGNDITSGMAIPADINSTAHIVARQAGTPAGLFLLERIAAQYGPGISVRLHYPDGGEVNAGTKIAELTGPAQAILAAERVMLNFLGRLSGIATLTHAYVAAVRQACPAEKSRPAVCDTRKTTPGWRRLEKYAVRCGGGTNHRMGLYDGVMLKDNHLAALARQLGPDRTLADLTMHVRRQTPPRIPVWLEVDTLAQLAAALPGGADIILLDNMCAADMAKAVRIRNAASGAKPLLEASGGISLSTIGDAARSGVDRISIGSLTHSAPWLDISMDFAMEHE